MGPKSSDHSVYRRKAEDLSQVRGEHTEKEPRQRQRLEEYNTGSQAKER